MRPGCRQVVLLAFLRRTPGPPGLDLHSPVLLRSRYIPQSSGLWRKLCSSYRQDPQEPAGDLGRHETSSHNTRDKASLVGEALQEAVRSLMDLGFTETQSVQLLKSVSDRREPVATQRLAMLSAFVAVGLNPSSVLKVLDKCPELHRMKVVQLQQRIDNLRKLGLLEGSLQRVLSHCPQLLTRTPKALNTAVRVLRERCHFSGQQVTDILRDTPATLLEDMAQVEYKFQYAYFRMGVRQAEMIKSGLFRVSLDEVRSRHAYLECLGLFETPDKKGQTRVANPKLRDFLGVPEKTFVAEVARTTLEEFEVFKRLLARKQQQEEEREEEEQLDSGSEEEEEEDGESEEDSDSEDSDHSTGYRRSKK